jgi:hypothetical protein
MTTLNSSDWGGESKRNANFWGLPKTALPGIVD